jgi:hypothetical protein
MGGTLDMLFSIKDEQKIRETLHSDRESVQLQCRDASVQRETRISGRGTEDAGNASAGSKEFINCAYLNYHTDASRVICVFLSFRSYSQAACNAVITDSRC